MKVPSVSREFTAPPMLGLKVGSMAPVVASKAKIRLRTRSSPVFVRVAAGLTEVKVPAAITLLPIWVIAMTAPFMACGVLAAGTAETTWLTWSALTAGAGDVPRPSSDSAETVRPAAARPRVRLVIVLFLVVRDEHRPVTRGAVCAEHRG